MPIAAPVIDDLRYQQLVDETLARVPVHTPEWTNFSHSDPGVTLVQLFAFLTENMLYRANQIPDRNRLKFLQLLGIPLMPASAAQALVTIGNDRAGATVQLIGAGLEVLAGDVPFRTTMGLAVLPLESRVYFKRVLRPVPPELLEYYRLLYASYQAQMPAEPQLYQTAVFDGMATPQVDLGGDTVDHAIWIALLAPLGQTVDAVRQALGGQTLTLGLVPALDANEASAAPGLAATNRDLLRFEMPSLGSSGMIARDVAGRPIAAYRTLDPIGSAADLLHRPGCIQLPLPDSAQIGMWQGLDPLELGVGDLPPSLDDTRVADRLVTWLRVSVPGSGGARLLWAGINAVPAQQRESVLRELLPEGDGQPDQTRHLSRAPVLPGSIIIHTVERGRERVWREIDDLMAAGPEVAVTDRRAAPGLPQPAAANPDVFRADCEAGVLTFGDGLHGRRLPAAAVLASYDFCLGSRGNVDAGALNAAPALPSGLSVGNPVRSWGGADAETVAQGQRQISRYLQHRNRLVNATDFETIAWRTPDVEIGRIEVLAAYHPDLDPNEPGSAPGVVTVMAIPRHDVGQPDAPRANRLFVNAICAHLSPRRLVTTELVVRGPSYKPLWISIGIDVAAGFAVALVVEAVKLAIRRFLSPLPEAEVTLSPAVIGDNSATQPPGRRGWALRAAVNARVLLAEAARVPGVTAVNGVFLAQGNGVPGEAVEFSGLELPRVVGLSVAAGDPVDIAQLRGDLPPVSGPVVPLLPVPVMPESC